MKPSEQLLFQIIPLLLKEKEQVEYFIQAFEDKKVSDFFSFLCENTNLNEETLKQIYNPKTYKSYKSKLKKQLLNYCIIAKINSVGSDIRRSMDIVELYDSLPLQLYKETAKEINLAHKKATGDVFINLRTILIGMELRNERKSSLKFSTQHETELIEIMLSTLKLNYNNMNIYSIYLKVAKYFTERSFIRKKDEYLDLKLIEKELLNFEKNYNFLNSSADLYFYQAKSLLNFMFGNIKTSYEVTLKTYKLLEKMNFPEGNFRTSQLLDQIGNSFLYGHFIKHYEDYDFLKNKTQELLSNDHPNKKSYETFFNYFYALKDADSILREDLILYSKDLSTNLPEMFYSQYRFIIAIAFANLGMFKEASSYMISIYNAPKHIKVKKDFYELSMLLDCIFQYELYKFHLEDNITSLSMLFKSSYDKFRKVKEEFPIENIILKQLLKITANKSKEKRDEIFKKIESEIFTEIENNEHSKIFYKFINLYFNIENWIKDNKESMPTRNRT